MNKRASMLIGAAVIMAFLQVCPTHSYAEQDVDNILSSYGEEVIEESISEEDPFEADIVSEQIISEQIAEIPVDSLEGLTSDFISEDFVEGLPAASDPVDMGTITADGTIYTIPNPGKELIQAQYTINVAESGAYQFISENAQSYFPYNNNCSGYYSARHMGSNYSYLYAGYNYQLIVESCENCAEDGSLL